MYNYFNNGIAHFSAQKKKKISTNMDVWASVAALLESGILYGHRKSCERAIQLKDKGNAYFAKSQSADTLQAVELYTEVIPKAICKLFMSRACHTGHILCSMVRGRAEEANIDNRLWAVVAGRHRMHKACSGRYRHLGHVLWKPLRGTLRPRER